MKRQHNECNKKLHTTRDKAKKALKIQKRLHRGAREKGIYFCDPCDGWHLTSLSAQSNRNLTNWKNKNLK